MKIVFPSNSDLGLTGSVYNHFGSAPFFVLVDTETNTHEMIHNKDLHHEHGKCQPIKALGNTQVDAVVVGGIGKGALRKLQAEGIKVFRSEEGSVQYNLDLFIKDQLQEFQPDAVCIGHNHSGGGGCNHH